MQFFYLNYKKISFLTLFLILIITFFSVDQWSPIKLSNFPLRVIVWSTLLLIIVPMRNFFLIKNDKKLFTFLNLYLIWSIICCIRGLWSFQGYIEFRHLVYGFFAVISPILIILFNKPSFISYFYKFWIKYAITAFLIFFYWQVGITQFYLSPILLLFCFYPLFPKKKKIIIILLIIIWCYNSGFEERAQLIKGFVSFIIGCLAIYSENLPTKLLKLGHFLGYFTVIVIFLYALTDFTNLISGKQSPYEINLGKNINVDSRSLLYLDVIESSIKHDYIIQGRTPARGHDIIYSGPLFYREDDDLNDFSRNERHFDEMLFGNIYTWEGLIGVLLLSCVYFKATYLAVYRSKNKYIKLLGCFIAFRWSFGWIEDPIEFNISTISLCCMIGMCYSSGIRNMNNFQFKQWIRTII